MSYRNMLKILILLTLFLTMQSLQAAEVSAAFKKEKVAVLAFDQNGDFGSVRDVGKMVAEWLTTSLVETGRFDTIERSMIDKLIQEQKLSASGIVDQSSALQLGKMYGVKTVVTGTIMSFDGKIEINARLIGVETGSIITTERVMGDSIRDLRSKVDEIADKIIQSFPLYGYVIRRSGKNVIIDLGRTNGVRVGMKMIAYMKGAEIRHPKTGEIIDEEILEKGQIIIREVKEKTSIGEVVSEKSLGCITDICQVRGFKKDEEERLESERLIQEKEAQRRADAELKAVQESRRKAEEERRLAEEARRAAEEARIRAEEELRKQKADEERRAREERQRARAKQDEEARLRRAAQDREQYEADERRRQADAEEQERQEAERARKARKKNNLMLPSF